MLKSPDFNLPINGPVMMYLVLDVQSTSHTDKCSQLNAWINVRSHVEAMEILHEELSLEGWALTQLMNLTIFLPAPLWMLIKRLNADYWPCAFSEP